MNRRSPRPVPVVLWRALQLTCAVLLLAAVLVPTPPSAQPAVASDPPAAAEDLRLAADTRDFRAGNIIADSVFFNGTAVNQQDVATFIVQKNRCTTGSSSAPCLKDFRQDTFNRAADGLCDGSYSGARSETAAAIIVKVARACSINPRALLVLLQKEQGLVTASSPTARQYQIATGMGCPDTAACDTQYYGFYNQLYSAARQFQKYAAYPTGYAHRAGAWNYIRWSPDAGCGNSRVYIENQATAGLYNYTPYQPNAAALRAGYGEGDDCSAYGNRNFWLYYTDWFGNPGGGYTVTGAIGDAWYAQGGGSGPLGWPLEYETCVGNGCSQRFQNGILTWTSGSGVRKISGALAARWVQDGRGASSHGYPVADMSCPAGGCLQKFQKDWLAWTADGGAHPVGGAIAGAWNAAGGAGGGWGYPLQDMACPAGGCEQQFQGTWVGWTAQAGVRQMSGAILATWRGQGRGASDWGYPVSDLSCPKGGCIQEFTGGSLTWTAAHGVRGVRDVILDTWRAADGVSGTWGYPVADARCTTGGCSQQFAGTEVHAASGASEAYTVTGAIGTTWRRQSAGAGAWGYPVAAMTCPAGGCAQQFTGGWLTWTSGAGVRGVTGTIATTWVAQDGPDGAWGYPVADARCTTAGCSQTFQSITVHAAAGGSGAFPVAGAIGGVWARQGGTSSGWGFPVDGMTCPAGGCLQSFRNGVLAWTSANGVRGVTGALRARWMSLGGPDGAWGYPVRDVACGLVGQGCRQEFSKGLALWAPGVGAYSVRGPIRDAYARAGAQAGSLRYPVGEQYAVEGGFRQDFQGGSLVLDSRTGVVTRR